MSESGIQTHAGWWTYNYDLIRMKLPFKNKTKKLRKRKSLGNVTDKQMMPERLFSLNTNDSQLHRQPQKQQNAILEKKL